jgi:Threonyl-tRNA synthetase
VCTTTDAPVEQEVQKIAKSKQKFDRLVVTKEEALELFAGNPFKEQIIKTKVPDGTRTTVYKCGDLIDLCRGPHVPHTGRVKAFAATRHSATSWLGDTDNDSLQRMYGISFPDKKMLKVWKENQEMVRRHAGMYLNGCLCCFSLVVEDTFFTQSNDDHIQLESH